jgi:hypothetical protein
LLEATLFGQLWRLEPLPTEKKEMWRREMEWLLCVSDHIVEMTPTWQTFPDGTKLEIMTCRPRSDLYVNLPALRKLDNMLLIVLRRQSFGMLTKESWHTNQQRTDHLLSENLFRDKKTNGGFLFHGFHQEVYKKTQENSCSINATVLIRY